ncbi:multisubunit Na+/H+ antiporter MnhF subunit [Clostridium tetanomorphum]|uniref:Cation:proton antiporter n=1 Tax=Clostridium tetanomorphum TaxID=1553 RepID=A0A923EA77_CLOTT|nr:monovalent cation/H+ antiporter complex subunit F [Clostridium tetanomorphum]KAJ53365.1 monovalent cation/H+ antiporter subunit F [Clostridium tetanomorphum DSM 665]MBC2396648.1 cation:proton antiporter [Clostridium tetanomorphum]MBP1863979.1 multisubunit Na+/H+ antiporter MnhF subunit [Clostridium tetanomorphum]NRS85057.1 multisubunit Na+/H+ antiporter MnhF subunit [Clostridium tetanomorphum]NRZ98274.1 multisubunit Na+/H+ antiporter MnhF subunit [Clostridium tetanomorphum]
MDMSFEFIFISILIIFLSFLLLYRVFIGPNIIDRVVAVDSIDVMVGLVMVLFGCYEGRSLYIDLGLIITLLGFIGTILISKYLEGKL